MKIVSFYENEECKVKAVAAACLCPMRSNKKEGGNGTHWFATRTKVFSLFSFFETEKFQL